MTWAAPALALAPALIPYVVFGQSSPAAPEEEIEAEEEPPEELSDPLLCYCVKYLRERHGINIYGDADTIMPNILMSEASVGDVILLSYDGIEHAALVTGFSATGYFIREANFRHCTESSRDIPAGDSSIRGFYRPATVY